MEHERFDELTRILAGATSRRGALKGIISVAAGIGAHRRLPSLSAAASLPEPLVATCTPADKGQPCGPAGGCGRCVRGFGGNAYCDPNPSLCQNAQSSDDHCPSCDPATLMCTPPVACGPCEGCVSNIAPSCRYLASGRNNECDPDRNHCDRNTGRCLECPVGQIPCHNVCVDPLTDLAHCGGCDHACGRCHSCENGVCRPCDDHCETCDHNGRCVSTCEGPCLGCRNGKCVDNGQCVCRRSRRPGSWPIGWLMALAPTRLLPHDTLSHCGPCEQCELDGCAPVKCGSPCFVCDPANGACASSCVSGQHCCDDTCCDGPCNETGDSCCPADQLCAEECCDADQQCCDGVCTLTSEGCSCPEAQICEGVGVPGDCCKTGQHCCYDGCCDAPCSPDGNCVCNPPSYAQCADDTGCCAGEQCCSGQCCQGTCVHYDTFDACCEVTQVLCSGNDGCCDPGAICCYSDFGLQCCNLSVYVCDKAYGCHFPFPG